MSGESCCNPEHHHCEPMTYDMPPGETWDCPECGRRYVAVRIGDRPISHPIQFLIDRGQINQDHMMWTSRPLDGWTRNDVAMPDPPHDPEGEVDR